MNAPHKIYCDEAGFTGSNLLDTAQPHFVFASTDITEDRAQNLLDQAVKKFRIERLRKGKGEFKGAELSQHHQGQQALDWLFNKCRKNIYVIVNNKQFAIAARFFDLTFEPLIASHNTFFFQTNFHRFVSIMIYAGLITGDRLILDAIENFHTIFQPRNALDGATLKSSIDRMVFNQTSTLQNILRLWQLNERKVLAEYSGFSDKSDKFNKWLIELSDTSLHTSLNFWGTKHKEITPFCDESKPLSELKPVVGDIIGKIGVGNRYYPVINKAQIYPIEFGKSHENAGLQIADLVASSFNYAANNRGKEFSEKLIIDYTDCISEHNLLPDLDEISPANQQAVRNYLMLLLLVQKSEKGGLVLTPELVRTLYKIQTSELPEEFLEIGQNAQ